MQKLTERMLLLGFLANLYKVELKWCEEASKVRKWTFKGTKSEPTAPKVNQLDPKGRPNGANGSQKGAKRKQKGAKGSQKGAKWNQKGAKREPKGSQGATKMRPKIDLRKRSRK